jgi:hypothetical protein
MKNTLSFEDLNNNLKVVLSMEDSHMYIRRHAFNQWIYSEKAQKKKEKGANPYEYYHMILEISNLTQMFSSGQHKIGSRH